MNPLHMTGWRMTQEQIEDTATDLRWIAKVAERPIDMTPPISGSERYDRTVSLRRDPVSQADLSLLTMDSRRHNPYGTIIHALRGPGGRQIRLEQPNARPGSGYGFDVDDQASEAAWIAAMIQATESRSDDPASSLDAEKAQLRRHWCILHHLASMLPGHVDPSLLEIRASSPMMLPSVGLKEGLGGGPGWRDEGPCGLLSVEAAIAWTADLAPVMKIRRNHTTDRTSYSVVHATLDLAGSPHPRDPIGLMREMGTLTDVPDPFRHDLLETPR